jgi:hypothetical protein
MVNDESGDHWEYYPMGFAAFLAAALTGEIRSEVLGYAFPKERHGFRPSGEFVD